MEDSIGNVSINDKPNVPTAIKQGNPTHLIFVVSPAEDMTHRKRVCL